MSGARSFPAAPHGPQGLCGPRPPLGSAPARCAACRSHSDCPRPGGRSSFGGQVMFTATAVPVLVAQDAYQKAFVARLPRIEARVRAAFRHLRCPYDRDDAVAEVVARAWERFRLVAHPDAIAADR